MLLLQATRTLTEEWRLRARYRFSDIDGLDGFDGLDGSRHGQQVLRYVPEKGGPPHHHIRYTVHGHRALRYGPARVHECRKLAHDAPVYSLQHSYLADPVPLRRVETCCFYVEESERDFGRVKVKHSVLLMEIDITMKARIIERTIRNRRD
jgi:hypothetical protein